MEGNAHRLSVPHVLGGAGLWLHLCDILSALAQAQAQAQAGRRCFGCRIYDRIFRDRQCQTETLLSRKVLPFSDAFFINLVSRRTTRLKAHIVVFMRQRRAKKGRKSRTDLWKNYIRKAFMHTGAGCTLILSIFFYVETVSKTTAKLTPLPHLNRNSQMFLINSRLVFISERRSEIFLIWQSNYDKKIRFSAFHLFLFVLIFLFSHMIDL